MRKKLRVQDLKSGMILAEPVLYGSNCNVLLDKNIKLTKEFINHLKKRNIEYVHIKKNVSNLIKYRNIKSSDKNIKSNNIKTYLAENVYIQSPYFERPEIKSEEILKKTDYTQKFNINRSNYRVLYSKKEKIDFSNEQSVFEKFKRFTEKISNAYQQIYFNRNLDPIIFNDISSEIVSCVKTNFKDLLEYSSISTLNNYILGHTINVTVLSIILGMLKNWDENKLTKLGVSALLHDVGMIKVEKLIWNKKILLNDSEKFLIKKHSIFGLDSLRKNTNFSSDICFPAYYHHEYMDGSGYPNGRKAHLIDEFSKIIGFIDNYSALISKRVWREPNSVENAFSIIMNNEEKFDTDLINLWQKFLADNVNNSILDIQPIDKKNILIIDDDKNSVDKLNTILKARGHKIKNSLSFSESISTILKSKIDIIILDLMFSNNVGFKLLENIKKIKKDIPVIILSEKCDVNSIIKAKKLNISGYIAKPFIPGLLLYKIKQIFKK